MAALPKCLFCWKEIFPYAVRKVLPLSPMSLCLCCSWLAEVVLSILNGSFVSMVMLSAANSSYLTMQLQWHIIIACFTQTLVGVEKNTAQNPTNQQPPSNTQSIQQNHRKHPQTPNPSNYCYQQNGTPPPPQTELTKNTKQLDLKLETYLRCMMLNELCSVLLSLCLFSPLLLLMCTMGWGWGMGMKKTSNTTNNPKKKTTEVKPKPQQNRNSIIRFKECTFETAQSCFQKWIHFKRKI